MTDLRINPTFFGINVLDTPSQINKALSGKVTNFLEIDLETIKGVFAFQPVLQVELSPLPQSVVFLGIKFTTLKDGRQIHTSRLAKRADSKLLFTAKDVADLTQYSRGDDMAGLWTVEASAVLFGKKVLGVVKKSTISDFLGSSKYFKLTSFELTIVPTVGSIVGNLNPDGTLRANARIQRTADVTVSMNDI
ncbi:MAG: hypothetical protein HYV90_00775 [Candidatus Woesebacteria bacterium]|nr:MAG: hypothetical protein HYV90_00775 [Candidatus Woesebacteria bacterium]